MGVTIGSANVQTRKKDKKNALDDCFTLPKPAKILTSAAKKSSKRKICPSATVSVPGLMNRVADRNAR